MEMKAGPDFSPRMSTERENWFPLSLNCTFNGQHNERSVSHLPTFNEARWLRKFVLEDCV